MKWIEPSNYDKRTKVKFLWWPKKINKVTKWLEFAEWDERYERYGNGSKWISKNWIEPPIENDPDN